MSWLYSRALVEAYSAASCSDGEPFALSSSTPTPQAYSWPVKTTAHSRLSQFGMTCEPLTGDRGEELLTWFLEDSRARTLAAPEAVSALMESAADCGERWRELSARFDLDTFSWKTAHCLFVEDLPSSSVTLPLSGTMRAGWCWELPMSAPCTKEKECGWLLPTPITIDTGSRFNRSKSPGAKLRPTIGAMARHNLWPTPTVKGNYNRKGVSKKSGDGLATMAGGPLNPTWVEWLMGWPMGWTEYEPLGTDKFQSWLLLHGK